MSAGGFFLPCASRPPDVCLLHLARPRRHYDPHNRSAYVTTRAGTDTMARRRQDADEDTIMESDDTAGAPTFGGDSIRGTRKVTPPSMPADLLAALAMSTTFGPKLFQISTLHAVSSACKVKVKDNALCMPSGDWRSKEAGDFREVKAHESD